MASSQTLSTTYQKKTDREHILDAPDTYIGSIEQDEVQNWIYDPSEEKMVYKKYNWIPGMYKCFDEGIVNARDHFIRMQQKYNASKGKDKNIIPVKSIDIDVDKETGVITMINDGNGIDVAKHPDYDIWIPEMIFAHLRTSTNYKKDEKKIVGGKNGFGFKLVLIYSKWGKIETVDHVRGLKYVQEYKNNLSDICKPKVTKCSKSKPYTKVTWLPDYERFGVNSLTDDMYNLFTKRTYDIAAVTDKTIKVKFNSQITPIKTFEQYVDMYIGKKSDTKRIYEYASDRWEYAVCKTPLEEHTQVSFVNGIYTSKGGKHVDYVLNQIIKGLVDYIEKKKKVRVKPGTIKEQLMIFVNCVVENPAFDSQTKDYMNTAVSKFGSSCKVSDKFIEKVAKLGVMEQAISINEVKHTKESKKTDGKKTRSVRGIPKLIDANYAGTAKSSNCTLILCEGDSAKAGIVSGLSKQDRNFIGVYPLKGKLMNIRDSTIQKINTNNEIAELKKIIGLESGKKYKTDDDVKKNLRYGKVLFMTDQDLDGTHIKGLCINAFQSQWHDLVKACDFMGFMNTPILKAKKGTREISFYNEKEYEDWKKENNDGKGWNIKYYKGLGTSSAKEFKEYFEKKKIVEFEYSGQSCDDAIDMLFRKTRTDDRKELLANYDKDNSLDTSKPRITYDDFIKKELIHFSKYDCERSIPNLVDGLKTSLRKILYAAFKRRLHSEIKVAQFGGYVSEHSGYHHGEASLMKAIVGMAQEYVGSNNINLLMPNGQFGTRLQGGDDSASERYIFTQLNNITKFLYPEADYDVLNYLDDDGTVVEPEFYVPIIPMILVNGSKGIGTGYSTDIPAYNPYEIVDYIKHYLTHKQFSTREFVPYYEGFKGDVIKVDDAKYLFKGTYEMIDDNSIRITELPVGTWTDNYKQFLEKQMDPGDGKKKKTVIIKDYSDMSTDTIVDITVRFNPGCLKKLLSKSKDEHINGVEDYLNLTSSIRTSNMNMFDDKQRLRKYETVNEIINTYIPVRMEYYEKRKTHMLNKLQRELMILSNKARFITQQLDDEIDLRRKKKDAVVQLLSDEGYDIVDDDSEYKYLRNMPIDSVIEENVEKLLKEKGNKEKEFDALKNKTLEEMWTTELDEFVSQYTKYRKERELRSEGREPEKKVKKIKKLKKVSLSK
jgi:DNA topoisomerase-2